MRTDPGWLTFSLPLVGVVVLGSALSSHGFASAARCSQEPDEQRWFSVGSAAFSGDFDADGATDVLAGSPGEFKEHGRVHIYSGRTGKQLREIAGPSGETSFGCAVAVLDDVNGDGRCDLLVGSTNDWPPGKGWVRLYSGADGALLHTLESKLDQEEFGEHLVVAPPAEDSIHSRMLVTCYLVGAQGKERTPAFACYEIDSWKLLWTASIPATEAAESGGDHSSCELGGRLDEDRIDDFLVSFVDDERLRRVRAISGSDGSTLWEIRTEEKSGWLDESYSRFGDLDKDGCEDVLVTRLRDTGLEHCVTVWTLYVLSGREGAVLREVRPAGVVPFSCPDGSTVVRMESMDGDEVPEIAIHSWSWAKGAQTVIVSGASGKILLDVPLVPHLTWPGTDRHELITGGDANADGTPDIVARVFSYDSFGFPDEGIHVYSGRDGKELFHKTCQSETPSGCGE